MANKYCNINGSDKIKDSYTQINTGFDGVEADMNGKLNKVDDSITDLVKLNVKDPVSLTISSGAITVTQIYHPVDTEGGESTDDLETINGGTLGDLLLIRTASSSRSIVIKTTGNIKTFDNSDIAMTNSVSTVMLLCTGSVWVVVGIQGVKLSGDTMTGRLQAADQFYYGSGSPEGVVAASVGSIYQRTNGGANTTLYVKESGSGNTGWVAK